MPRHMHYLRHLALIATLLVLSGATRADTWEALSGHFTANPGNGFGSQDFVFGGDFFVDGQFSPTKRTQVLIPTSQASSPQPSITLGFHNNGSAGSDWVTNAPQIDLTNMRADFSGLYWWGWNSMGTTSIGGNYGEQGWVNLINNNDGTYRASWQVSPNGFFSGAGTFSITVAAVVPEPASPAYLVGGLALLAVAKRRKNS